MKQDELIEAMARAITLCPVCEGEGTVCDGLDEAGCSIPCPPCSGTGYDARALLPVIRDHLEPTSEMVEAARKQGQDEGFAAAVSWLRDRSAQKPAAYLALEAELLANGLENSRLPAKAWSKSNG